MKKLQEKKYLVWIGGIANEFDNLLDAEIEKKDWEKRGYKIRIETIN